MSGENTKDRLPQFKKKKKTSLRGTHDHLLIAVQGDKRDSYRSGQCPYQVQWSPERTDLQ